MKNEGGTKWEKEKEKKIIISRLFMFQQLKVYIFYIIILNKFKNKDRCAFLYN